MTDYSDDLADLSAMLATLCDRVNDVFLRSETLRALMIEYGVFSQADFDLELQERQRLWSNRIYYLRAAKREGDKVAKRRIVQFKPEPR
jgi:hypothetical protein